MNAVERGSAREKHSVVTITWAVPWIPALWGRGVFTKLLGFVMMVTRAPRISVNSDKVAFIRRQLEIATMEMPVLSPTIVRMEAAPGPWILLVGAPKIPTAGSCLK